MNTSEKAATPGHAVDAQLLTFAQRMATAIPSSSYFYLKVHPSINVAEIATGQFERPEKLTRRGRPPDHRIDEACSRWDKGLRDIDDYVDLLPPDTKKKMRDRNCRSLKSALNKRRRADILAAKAKNAAKPRSD